MKIETMQHVKGILRDEGLLAAAPPVRTIVSGKRKTALRRESGRTIIERAQREG